MGAVYAMTNNPIRNEVVAFVRAADGGLTPAGRFDTTGMGSGSFENSDTALVVASAAGQSSPVDLGGGSDLVLAVNAGSDTVSVFRVVDDGLELVEAQATGGERPTSLTVHDGLLYVLNSAGDGGGAGLCFGGNPSVTGFTIEDSGEVEPIANSTRELSGGPSSGCAQVSFTPDGGSLLVSQITANTITAFPVDEDGALGEPVENEPVGNGPFGFTFDGEGRLLVTQNSQAAPELGTVASYEMGDDGRLQPIGETVATGETDPCWIVVTPDGAYAYATNFGPSPLLAVGSEAVRRGTISSFRIGDDGALELLDAQAAQLGVGAADLALAGDGQFLYALNSVAGTVSGFQIGD
ncbi:MAG: beta-propeller fold lactonase family protein, partial [Chloroflexia bacterium]|nr:beta-propeller fold lactonase family protein [Chloroflexia bacterium]